MEPNTIIYKRGDRVWAAKVDWCAVEKDCPDCLGTARWKVVLPTGAEWPCECPRCNPGGYRRSTGRVCEDYTYTATAIEGVVNMVRYDSSRPPGEQYEYGLEGSYGPHGGTIQSESHLFSSEAAALEYGAPEAERQRQSKIEYEVQQGARKRGKRAPPKIAEAPGAARSIMYAASEIRAARKKIAEWQEFARQRGTELK